MNFITFINRLTGRSREGQELRAAVRQRTKTRWPTLSSVQDHHPRRGRLHDQGRAVRVATDHGERGPDHQVLPDLQLRQPDHRTLDVQVRQVQVQAVGQGHHHRQATDDR